MRKRGTMGLCLAIFIGGGGFLAATAQAPAQDRSTHGAAVGDPEAGKSIAETKCAICHGADGNSADPKTPKLASQNPAYLYWQLWAFKRGTRKSDVMSGIVAALSDSDMANTASFYSRQNIQSDPVQDPRLAAIGERIFSAGVGPGMMSSCAMCHGSGRPGGMSGMMGRMSMMGMMGGGTMGHVPNLNSQHAAYIIDQLNRFADGERQGSVMNRIAAALNETDKRAVAEFLSGNP